MSRLRNFFFQLFMRNPEARKEAHPDFVKVQFPQSSFTKKGPGVTAQIRTALKAFTQEQRAIAYRKGWDRGLLRKTRTGKYRLRR